MGRQGIIHRDLKPENILLNSKIEGIFDLRIADFGFTVHLESPDEENQLLLNSICGTPGYIAPEVLNENPFNLKADVFSVGSILYSIFTLKNLFNGQSYQEIMD
jgi:serine/threonine protein kinase